MAVKTSLLTFEKTAFTGRQLHFEMVEVDWNYADRITEHNFNLSIQATGDTANKQYVAYKVAWDQKDNDIVYKSPYDVFTYNELKVMSSLGIFGYPKELKEFAKYERSYGSLETENFRVKIDNFLPTDPANPFESVSTKIEKYLNGDYGNLKPLKFFVFVAVITGLEVDGSVDVSFEFELEKKESNSIINIESSDFSVLDATETDGVYVANTPETPIVHFEIDNVLYPRYYFANLVKTSPTEESISWQYYRDERVEFEVELSGEEEWEIRTYDEEGILSGTTISIKSSDGVSDGSGDGSGDGSEDGSGDGSEDGSEDGSGDGGSTPDPPSPPTGTTATGITITETITNLDSVTVTKTLSDPIYHALVETI